MKKRWPHTHPYNPTGRCSFNGATILCLKKKCAPAGTKAVVIRADQAAKKKRRGK